jgi:DNA uptake protein ComE-like DNA-binding protein
VIWGILCVLLVYILVARYARPLWLGEEIGVDASRVEQVEQRIDPNVAGWPELARLPGIGEATAKRIVAHREEILARRSAEDASLPMFTSLRDLDAVRGIGPKTLEEIAPYLRFPGPENDP